MTSSRFITRARRFSLFIVQRDIIGRSSRSTNDQRLLRQFRRIFAGPPIPARQIRLTGGF